MRIAAFEVSPSAKVFDFLKEWTVVVPNVFYYPRKKNPLKKMIEWAKGKESAYFLILCRHYLLTYLCCVIADHVFRSPTGKKVENNY